MAFTRRIVSLIFAALLTGFLPGYAAATDLSSKHRLESIQLQIEQITKQVEYAQEKRGKLSASLRQAELKIARAVESLRIIRIQLAKQESSIKRLDRKASLEKKTVAEQIELLRAQVIAAYEMGQEPVLKLLLNQKNLALIGRILGYYDYLNKEREKTLDAARASLAALLATRRQIDDERKQLQALLESQQAKEIALKNAEKSRIAALAALDRNIVSKQNRLKRLRADAKGLQSLIARVGRVIGKDNTLNKLSQRPFAQQRGRLPWPTNGPLEVSYGALRSGSGGSLRWEGVLIRAPKGRLVRAIDAGHIVFANWLRGYGLLLIIDHGNGFMSLYGHLEAIYRPVGTWVRRGEVVASVGDSGGLRQSALYFAIRHRGAPLNPQAWCRGTP